MVDDHYQETDYCRNYLRSGHQKLWWYIEQNDYNLYYCENKVYTEYRKIGENSMRVALTGHRPKRLGLPENEADDAWEKIEEWIVKQLFKMNEVCYLERERI